MVTKPNLSTYTDWRTACTDMIAYMVESGVPFSSGEITREIRLGNPNLRFSATTLGEYVKEQFYGGTMPNYLDAFDQPVYPVQVPRTTQGLGRTPAGLQVFVYAPDQASGDAHPFEVDIPVPGGTVGQAPAVGPATPVTVAGSGPHAPAVVPPPAPPTPFVQPTGPVVVHGAPSALRDHRATIGADRRLTITRGALEAYSHAAGTPIRATDPVFVSFLPGQVVVTLIQPTTHAFAPYDLTRNKGQIVIASPAQPFTPGEVFKVDVSATALVVDLSKNLATTV
jgi:hypothetical protein